MANRSQSPMDMIYYLGANCHHWDLTEEFTRSCYEKVFHLKAHFVLAYCGRCVPPIPIEYEPPPDENHFIAAYISCRHWWYVNIALEKTEREEVRSDSAESTEAEIMIMQGEGRRRKESNPDPLLMPHTIDYRNGCCEACREKEAQKAKDEGENVAREVAELNADLSDGARTQTTDTRQDRTYRFCHEDPSRKDYLDGSLADTETT